MSVLEINTKRTADVIIIGGGLQGCSAALHLAARGVEVLVLERDHVGRHASAANAGGVRRAGRHISELELSAASHNLWQNLSELTGSDGGFRNAGHLFVAENEEEMTDLRRRCERVHELGFTFEEMVSAQEVYEAVPGIAKHVVGGLAVWGDGYANPFTAVRAFKDRAITLGARIYSGVKVDAAARVGSDWILDTTDGIFTSATIINCAGFGGARVAAMFGDNCKLSVEAPMMMVTEPVPNYTGPVLGRVKGRLSLKASSNGSILVGGGHRARFDQQTQKVVVDFAGVAKSALTLKELLPDLALGRLQRVWYGLEAYTMDGLPILGPSPNAEGVIHAFAFSGHGFQLGPIVGRVLSDLAIDGATSFNISAFDLGRFDDPTPQEHYWCSVGARSAVNDSPSSLPLS